MIEDESYSVLYLYSAVIEYVYFVIVLIQDRGPNDLNNIAKHVKFFKKDVYTFIQIFNGKNLAEKIGQMLFSTTSVFEIKDDTLHLTNSHESFTQIIYKDLLISKVVDLILRGICTVQDICRNLNFSSVIHIKEEILIALLKHNPHFYFNSDSSVILVQFHGLVGFESQAYHTTVQYFQSCLQNVSLLSYNEIKLHSRFVPSCTVQNSLLIFCILHISILFKCKSDKVSLRKKLKRKNRHNQVLNIEKVVSKISVDSVPIGMLVRETLGPNILCWVGEVSSLTSNAGLIQCVVNFTNGHQGIFAVYFYKTALKCVCEVGNVRNFLNVRDVVEFDAEFCGETLRKDVVWQATRIKVVEYFFKENKHVLNTNTDLYIKNIDFNYHKLKPVIRDCTKKNCVVKYTILEKDTPTKNNSIIPEKDVSNNNKSLKRLNSNDDKEENISKILCQTSMESQEQEVEPFNSSKISDSCVQDNDKLELNTNQLLNSNCDDAIDTLNQIKASDSHYLSVGNLEVQKMRDKAHVTCNGYIKQSISQEINEQLLNFIKKDSEQSLVSNHHDAKNSDTLSFVKSTNVNSILHSSLMPNVFNNSSFILGEVTFMSTYNGVAQSLKKNKLQEIFFEKSNIKIQNGATNTLVKGNQVLLFIPYADLEDSVLIATLVYPLTYEDTIMIIGEDLSAKDFVVNHFFPMIKKNFSKTYFCCCDLLQNLSASTQSDQSLKNRSEILLNHSQFIEQLRELFQFNHKTYRNLFSLVSHVCATNLVVSCMKLLKHPSFTFLRSLLWIRHSRNFVLYPLRKKNIKRYKVNAAKYKKYKSLPRLKKEDCNNDSSSTYSNENDIPKILLKPSSVDETCLVDNNSNIIKLNTSGKKFKTENSVIKQSCLEVECDGKSSISSFVSCFEDSSNESSDDVFYSCESDSSSESHSESNDLRKIDKTPHSPNAISGICNIVSKNTFACIGTDTLNEMESSGIVNKRKEYFGDANKYLKFRNFSLFKHKRNKCKIVLPSENVFCKSCHPLPIKMTAEISILRQSTLYLRPKCSHQNITLAFPISFVPTEMKDKVKLNATVKATIIPHLLMNFSRVLYIDFI